MPEDRPGPRPSKPGHIDEVRVRYAETDQMGRAYHGQYVVWCEVGRTALMRDHGVSYGELERRGVYLPVARLEIEYRDAAYYDDVVRIETWIRGVQSRRVTFSYALYGPGDRLLARALTDLICIDEEGRARRLPDDIRTALEGISEC